MVLEFISFFFRRKLSILHPCIHIAICNMHTGMKICNMHIAQKLPQRPGQNGHFGSNTPTSNITNTKEVNLFFIKDNICWGLTPVWPYCDHILQEPGEGDMSTPYSLSLILHLEEDTPPPPLVAVPCPMLSSLLLQHCLCQHVNNKGGS
jgi:hypothetical protein